MVRTRRRGYTLIEMMVVVVILALFASLLAPSYANIRDSQKRRAFYTSAADLAGTAREKAISLRVTMYLQADTSQNRLVLKEQVNDSTFQPSDGNSSTASTASSGGHTSSGNLQTNIGTATNDRSNDTVTLNLPLPDGVQLGNFQLAGAASDSSGWKLEFFPDGTSEGGAVEFNDRGSVRSLVVNKRGGAQIVDGTIPDTSQDNWSAGNYVQRQQ